LKRHFKFSIAALVVLCALGIAFYLHFREPSYRGRTLSEWVKIAEDSTDQEGPQFKESVSAIKAIGMDAALQAIRWLHATDEGTVFKAKEWLMRQSYLNLKFPSAEEQQKKGFAVLEALQGEKLPIVPEVMKFFANDKTHEVAFMALHYLFGESEEAQVHRQVAMLDALSDNSAEVQSGVLKALTYEASSLSAGAADKILPLLTSKNSQVRASCAVLVGHMVPGAPRAVPPLLNLLLDSEARVRAAAVEALGSFPESDKEIVPALLTATKDANPEVRFWAAASLGDVGGHADAVIPALTLLLQDPINEVREAAIHALGAYRSQATNAIPALQKLISPRDIYVNSKSARGALNQIAPNFAGP
jgi:hypothetical protein